MKLSFGIIALIMTIVFSYMAIQNNKIAKEITVREFGLSHTVNKGKKIKGKNSFDQKWEKSQKEFQEEWDNWKK